MVSMELLGGSQDTPLPPAPIRCQEHGNPRGGFSSPEGLLGSGSTQVGADLIGAQPARAVAP